MKRRPCVPLIAALAALFVAHGARAESEAFLGLQDLGSASWARDRQVGDALEGGLGFGRVAFNIDATPGELFGRAVAFLTRRAAPGARRLVWISGPADRASGESPCPAFDAPSVRPAAATLIVAPACFAGYLDLPADAERFAIRDAGLRTAGNGSADRSRPPVVFVALPSDSPEAIRRADAIVFGALHAAAGGRLTPAVLLQQLRYELRVDGSDYTPELVATPVSAAWSRRFLTPAGAPAEAAPDRAVGVGRFGGRLAWPRRGRLDLFGAAAASEAPVVSLHGGRPVTVLRTSADGTMGFARAAGSYFGWVALDALD